MWNRNGLWKLNIENLWTRDNYDKDYGRECGFMVDSQTGQVSNSDLKVA